MNPIASPIEIIALKKLAVVCGAVAKSLGNTSAGREQLALTKVLVDVVNRLEASALRSTKGS